MCVLACAHMHMFEYRHICTIHMCGNQRTSLSVNSCFLPCLRQVLLLFSTVHFKPSLEVYISVSYFGIGITNTSYRIWFYMSYEAIGPHACIVSPHSIHLAYFFLTQAFWLKLDLHITLAGQPSLGIPLPQPFMERIPAVCLFTQFSSYSRALNLVSVHSCLVL